MTVQDHTQQEPRLGVDVIGFGVGEFAYLLNVFEGPARDRSVSVFRAEEMVDDVTLATAGASSLMARDMATVDEDGDLGVTGVAAAVATALGKANRWTEITLLTGEAVDNVALLEAPGVSLMLQPRLLGTWFVFAQDPAITSAEATLRVVRQHVKQNHGGTAYLVFKTLGSEQHLLIRREGDAWTTGVPDFDKDEVAETAGLDDAGLLAAIEDARGAA
ncbi:hypothetical protein B1A87_001920 [Arthrobacter sp. KBS0703]|uniref:hypothetical protein n=1 Tax=Arthrobacter sp. KBS0703 TaxID=1955698 RepID=UPI00098EE5D0|nr:hypothetical protein [Arthrobacter sp. KBS0703]TSE14859.1 hypothetical protein B1A87_001920 [Arthrobacter sp. KBS0703]